MTFRMPIKAEPDTFVRTKKSAARLRFQREAGQPYSISPIIDCR